MQTAPRPHFGPTGPLPAVAPGPVKHGDRLWHDLEGVTMPWAKRLEMASVESRDERGLEPLGQHGNRSVRSPKRKISVLLHHLGDSGPLLGKGSFDFVHRKRSKEASFGPRPKTGTDQVRYFGHYKSRYDEDPARGGQSRRTSLVVIIVEVGSRVQGATVDDADQGSPRNASSDHSSAKICSASRAVLLRPLLPSPTKPGLRPASVPNRTVRA